MPLNHHRYSETKTKGSKVSQRMEGISEDIEGSLIIFIIVMLILAEWCFWWKSVLWGNGATQVISLQIKWRIFWILKFGYHGHILQGSKKNLNSSLSFGRGVNRRTDWRILKIFLPGFRIQSNILTDFWIMQLQQIADSSIFCPGILDFACNSDSGRKWKGRFG